MDNPNITLKDERIIELDSIVQEVKESEEWEALKMNILEIGIKKGEEIGEKRGIERGIKKGIEQGIEQGIKQERESSIKVLTESYLEDDMPEDFIVVKLGKKYNLSEKQAKEIIKKYKS